MNKKIKEIVAQNEKFLESLLDNIRDPRLSDFMFFVFSPQGLLDKFLESPASRRNHHAFSGGLAYHSIHAAKLARDIARHYNRIGIKVDEDIVVAGTLIHDIGKIHCYSEDSSLCPRSIKTETDVRCGCNPQTKYHHVPRASLFHHIPMGYLDVAKLADTFNYTRVHPANRLSQEKIDKLLHIVLSHHGRRMWSSPVLPKFIEAYIVHSVEMMDGYVDKFNEGEIPKTIYDGTNY